MFYKGALEYKVKGTEEVYQILPNTVVWLPKGQSYTFTSVGEEGVGFIALSFLTEGKEPPFQMLRIPVNNKDIASMFDDALKLALAKDIAYNIAVKSKISWIIFMLLRLHMDDPRLQTVGYEGLHRSVDYIHKHLGEKISQKQLASISGYSQSYYRRRFQMEYRMSPVHYINLKRVEKAQKLLLGGLHTKSEIAQICGFENQQFFARVFKKYTGKTPSGFCKTFEPESECEI